jgi:nucleoside-diphosphate-sugar epimerase
MADPKQALVLGATGVTGRSILRHLVGLPDWDVVAVSRRRPDLGPDLEGRFAHLALDLLDADACRARLGELRGLTHVFFAAYVEGPGWAESVAPNVTMLRNVLDAVEPAAPGLRHVNLMHGTKWYGNHLGPFPTPAREDDPRHMPPNFYYDQQDLVAERQRGKQWTWSAARPHGICGFAVGTPMNLVMVIGVYAAICRELGVPFGHPGTAGNYRALYQVTDADHLARAVLWMATEARCANEAFNITNGDVFRWERVWPRLADHFGLPVGPQRQLPLARMMADKASVWERVVAKHDLRPYRYEEIVSWAFGDFVFTPAFDIVSSMTKARQHGFHEVVDSEAMFVRIFDRLRTERVLP